MRWFILLVLCFANFATAQETEPELLKEAPEGWRFERLEFPLQFAADLKLEGYEELWFAPGMFDPESSSYFSYVLAMQINNHAEVSEEMVKDLFQQYFKGLCETVGKSRELNLDLEQIKTEVQLKDEIYKLQVDMFDAFGSGKPLKLTLKVTAHVSARDDNKGLVLLGLASPANADAEIWKQLETFREGFGAGDK